MIELTAMLSISRPSAHYRAHADFMGIGVTADADIDIHDVQIYMDATATLTAEGIPEGGLQLKNFYVSDRKKLFGSDRSSMSDSLWYTFLF